MPNALLYRTLNHVMLGGFRRAAREFERALGEPERKQREILLQLLQRNATSLYGKKYFFDSIRSIEEYQQRVPVVAYDDLAPWIERIKTGETGVLTTEPVLMFEKSSGSASAAKYIPYTRTLRAQFQAALGPWMRDMYGTFGGIDLGCAYWLVTPLCRDREITSGGIPVGFESDIEYFGRAHRWIIGKTMAIPPELGRVTDLENCIYLTLLYLLQARALAFISVWNPSLLLILLEKLEQYGDRLVDDLLSGDTDVASPLPSSISSRLRREPYQAEKLRAMLRRGRIEATVLWPQLRLISCWTSAESARVIPELEQRFPGVAVQSKGLLATEGVVSIPIEAYGGCVAAVTSHFPEFIDERGDCRLLSELEKGRDYSVLLTTGGGLWRYRLGDRVRVKAFASRTPILEFLGKEDSVGDLRGEKLNALFVANLLAGFDSCRSALFAVLAPSDAAVPHYTLFLESPVCEPDLALRLDEKLQANPHYRYCREIGQLARLRLFRIRRGGREAFLKQCEVLGQRAGAVKLASLNKQAGWERVFEGAYADAEHMAQVCA
jgi:GH3 auxin-responsive promoter